MFNKLTNDVRLKSAGLRDLRLELCQQILPFYEEFARQQVQDPALQGQHAHAFLRLALVRFEMGQAEQAAADFRRAEELFTKLAADSPTEARVSLYVAYQGRAEALDKLVRHDEAAVDWKRAADLADGAASRIQVQLAKMVSWARTGRTAEAVAEAEALAGHKHDQGKTWYELARVYALAAERGDAGFREHYAARAVALLRQAAELGYFQANGVREGLKTDADFAALRGRNDYQDLFR
jgi:tetratricopeptide (TPR) repeat protein